MILLDDNFASIVNGIEEGRIIFDNLKKSIAYTLSSNIPEISPFLLYQTAGLPLPLSTQMILLVDLGTDLAPAISMAYEPKESDIMSRKPRNPDIHKLVTWKLVSFSYLQIGMLQAVAGFYAYFVVLMDFGLEPGFLLGLDEALVFDHEPGKDEINRDAYYLWCWDNSNDCLYYPDFSTNATLGLNYPFYDQQQWDGWMGNNNDAYGYSQSAKENIVNVYNDETGADPPMEYCLLSNEDDACDTLDLGEFYADYWFPVVLPYFFQHTYTSSLYENRRCFATDYYGEYCTTPDCDDHKPQFCDTDEDRYPNKPRTVRDTPTSLFPMQQRTRTEALYRSNSAYFVSIIVVQWADLMICKTRMQSLFEQGMMNTVMNYSLFFETILGAFIVYIPLSHVVLNTRPLKFVWWTAAVPFSLLIYIYDEMRKGWIRKYPRQWLHRNTYW
jgi:hypothetical protein